MRQGDDLQIAVATPDEARDAKSLVRATLHTLDLLVNDDKTLWLRQQTYIEHRTDVTKAVEEYLKSSDELDRHFAIENILDALRAEEELVWDWYHSDLRVPEVISRVGSNLQSGEEQALLVLLDAVVEEEGAPQEWNSRSS